MSHIFISYSTRNSEYALSLAEKLRSEGFDVWIDHNRLVSSDDWWRSIVMALRSCGAVVVILTPDSDRSRWVQREITLAEKYDKPLFPLWLDGSLDTPNWELFVRTQYEDVRGHKMPEPAFYERLSRYATRKATRGENVTKLVASDGLQLADADTEMRAEMANPPVDDSDERSFTQPRYRPAPTSGPRRTIAAALMLSALVVIGGLLLVMLSGQGGPLGAAGAALSGTDEIAVIDYDTTEEALPDPEMIYTVADGLDDYLLDGDYYIGDFLVLLDSEDGLWFDLLADPSALNTVFIPVDEAVEAFYDDWSTNLESMQTVDGPFDLTAFLNYHIAPGYAYTPGDGETVLTMKNGEPLFISESGKIEDQYTVLDTIYTDTGPIHIIDAVLLPLPPFDEAEDG